MDDEQPALPPVPLGADEIAEVAMGLPDSVFLVDSLLQVLWANRSAERLFGMRLADSAGMSGLDFIHPDDFESAAHAMSSVQSKDVGTPLEIRVLAHDGWRLVELIGAPLDDHLVLSLRDLTERRRWEVAYDADARFRCDGLRCDEDEREQGREHQQDEVRGDGSRRAVSRSKIRHGSSSFWEEAMRAASAKL